ncbi:hypothetical protein N658DRAFT_142789, partial [Parathielavia hyrcaniae]
MPPEVPSASAATAGEPMAQGEPMVQDQAVPDGRPDGRPERQARDIRQELADVINGDHFPALKTYFNTTQSQIIGNDDDVNAMRNGNSPAWLFMMEHALWEYNMRYNALTEEKEALQTTARQFENDVGVKLRKSEDAAIYWKARATALDDVIKSGTSTGTGNHNSGTDDHKDDISNTVIQHPDKFSGDEANSTKRT